MALASTTNPARASEHCSQPIAQIVSAFGTVEYRAAPQQDWREASLDLSICPEDSIRTGVGSRAAIVFPGTDTVLRIDQNTELKVRSPEAANPSLLELLIGSLHFFTRTPRPLTVQTPFVNAGVEGTEFFIGVTDDRASIIVFEGRLRAQNDLGTAIVTNNQAAEARANQAPALQIVARPRDAVQWTLFYPPVFTDPTNPALSTLLRRTARLLAAGQAGEAADALATAPDSGDVLALRTVIAVARNEQQQALELGHRAVAASPESAAAKIALSYAQQASFDLEAARDTVVKATEQQPEDALAWARLAELWLSFGDLDRSLEAAEIAAMLAPELGRTNMVLGFAYLAQIRTKQAQEAFARAITLDSQEPLARLGLGLAKIRQGALSKGRRDIEIAAALDPGSAVMRSYLGKAYFEEGSDIFSPGYFRDFFAQRRYEQAATQLSMAKELDPNDPTPWFYDATLKQARNDPIGALADIRKSIELNDSRAVYRSRFLLDQDRASRGISLARIYQDLGFQQLGVNEASRSLTSDPANPSAHRFLSDTYRGTRRTETARVSELMQAQLLQDINVNPVQPSLSETNLNIIASGGPTEVGLNEFNPLFESDQLQLNTSGQIGNNDTKAGEGVISGLFGQLSFSLGAFSFQSDGFRSNNSIDHEIYDMFAQAAITPELNVQAEFRSRNSEQGDLAVNFDPDQFLEISDRTLHQDIARFGLRYSPTPNSDILVSYIYSDRQEETSETRPLGAFDFVADAALAEQARQVEAQYLYRDERFNVTAGFARIDVDSKLAATGVLAGFPIISVDSEPDIKHPRGYIYANVRLPDPVSWTLGVGFDDYKEEGLHVQEISPKFGVQWDVTDNVRLRGAVFHTVKPALVSNRTIEPTQIAGFNQFFDDVNATESTRYGVGFDWAVTSDLSVGSEATWRDLDEPLLSGSQYIIEDRDEELHHAYVYWTPLADIAVSGEVVYDLYKTDASIDDDLPRKVETISVPVGVRYFHRSGLFAGASATYVDQKVDRSELSSLADGKDKFVVVDAAVGWRFPNRIGIASLEVRNLFDKKFKYQDDSFREFSDEPSIGPYIPDRTVLARMTLSF